VPLTASRPSRWRSALPRLASPLLVALLLVACGDGGSWPPMMRMMGQQAMELPDGIPASELPDPESRGARLVARYCSQCHGIPSPKRHAPEDWEATARRMFRRMDHMQHMRGMGGMMGGGMHRGMMDVAAPSADEERAVVAYLREHAMRGARVAELPADEGRETFGRVCSRCHALPDPAQHTAGEWPDVVRRMRGHMERMEVQGISDREAGRIVRYLKRAASEGDP